MRTNWSGERGRGKLQARGGTLKDWSQNATHWSQLLQSGEHGWAYFYERYQGPVAALFRRGGLAPEQVGDLVQEFFLTSLQRSFLERASPDAGRFRGYLATAARRFLTSHYRASGRQKRNPEGMEVVPLDEGIDLPAEQGLTPEEAFDLQWARDVLARATAQVEADYAARGKQAHAEAFARKQAGESWAEIAAGLGVTEASARGWVARYGDKLARLVRVEVTGTVASEAELDAELAYLSEILNRG